MIPCGISDHDLIFMTKNIRSPKSKFAPRIINIRNQKRFDLRAFQHDILNNIPFDEIKAVTMLMKFGFNGKLSSLMS